MLASCTSCWKNFRTFFLIIFTGLFFLIFSSVSIPGSKTVSKTDSSLQEIRLQDSVIENLEYLLRIIGDNSQADINMGQIAAIIDFVSSDEKTWPALYYSEDNFGSRSVYHQFDIDQEFSKILEYSYTPKIPSHVMIPSSVRLSYWKNCNGANPCRSWSWDYPVSEGHFQVVRGMQHETTTPDVSSWTYYNYDLERMLILTRYKDLNVFFSISKQQDRAPGKKAYAVGDDQDWNYLYTQETGVNRSGLGWLTPYMYSSFSITVFVEQPDRPSVKCAMFKWLNAGAANINMVRKHHIYEGIKRFEAGFKTVLENPNLPEPEKLMATFLQIEKLSTETLKKETRTYLKNLKSRYPEDDVFKNRKLAEFFLSPEYLDQLTHQEMKSILRLEYMKTILGKDPIIETAHIFPD